MWAEYGLEATFGSSVNDPRLFAEEFKFDIG
jgi:hypothetical protein